jgi:hypothetical protein
MAKEKKHESGGKKKKHLTGITTHKADGGGFVHQHHYQDEDGNPQPDSYGGVSTDMADLQQHMQDHFGPDADQGGGEQPDDGSGAGAAPAAAAPAQAQ